MLFSLEELNSRINSLKSYLRANEIDLAILSQNTDIYYYAGSLQPLYLVIPAEGEPIALARKSLTRINAEVEHIAVQAFSGGKDLAAIVARHGLADVRRIALTLDAISYSSATRMQRLFPKAEMRDIAWDMRMLRAVKSESEIAIQSRAGKIAASIPDIVRAGLKLGMTELELSAHIENYLRLNGHASILRCRREGMEIPGSGLCSSGVNSLSGTKFEGICSGAGLSAGAPYGASHDPIPEGIPIILDYALNLDGYIIDQTRMASIGRPSTDVMAAYDAMCSIEQEVIKMLRPGMVWGDIYDRAVNLADKMGYADTFMGVGTERVRFVGHGVGTELDEPPYIAQDMKYELAAGMVLAVEPKVALPGIGVIGIEDTLVVRDSGAELITTAPSEFIIV